MPDHRSNKLESGSFQLEAIEAGHAEYRATNESNRLALLAEWKSASAKAPMGDEWRRLAKKFRKLRANLTRPLCICLSYADTCLSFDGDENQEFEELADSAGELLGGDAIASRTTPKEWGTFWKFSVRFFLLENYPKTTTTTYSAATIDTGGLIPDAIFASIQLCSHLRQGKGRGSRFIHEQIEGGGDVMPFHGNSTIEVRDSRFLTAKTVTSYVQTHTPTASPDREARSEKRKAFVSPILREKGWTRGKLATHAGVGKNSVYDYLNGARRTVTIDNRKALADSLGVNVTELPD